MADACAIGDIGCQITQAFSDIIMPYLIPIILVLVALFILPKAGWRGVVLSLVLIFMILWWFGLVPGIPRLGR